MGILILVAIISGIIIDAFAGLREDATGIKDDEEGVCFICGKERGDFDSAGIDFDTHKSVNHNPWRYAAFRKYLALKSESEYSGQESYVKDCMDNGDLSFFPIDRSLELEVQTPADDEAAVVDDPVESRMTAME